MIRKLNLFLLIVFFSISTTAFCQTLNSDSTKLQYDVYCNFLSDYPYHVLKKQKVDTSIAAFSSDDLIFTFKGFYNPLSNVGTAHQNLFFKTKQTSGFEYGYDCFDKYVLKSDNVMCYSSEKPYTSLSYLNAPGNDRVEESFYVVHNQKLGKTIHAGANFSFINSRGFYEHQHAMVGDFSANLRFRTIDDRYGFLFAYYHSRINNEENGGLVDDTQFTENLVDNPKIMDVYLQNARNFAKNGGWLFTQDFYIKQSDSTNRNILRLYHTANFVRDRRAFYDSNPDSAFYKLESQLAQIFDSTAVNVLKNRIALSTYDDTDENGFMVFEVGADVVYSKVISQYKNLEDTLSKKTAVFNFIPYGKLLLNFKWFKLEPRLDFSLGNYNNADFNFNLKLFSEWNNVNFGAMYRSSATDQYWFYDEMFSTTFNWNNDFKKQFTNGLDLFVDMESFGFDAKYNLINNYVYLNEDIVPVMVTSPIHNISLSVDYDVDFWKFSLNCMLLYQYVDKEDVIHLPDLTGKLRFTFNQPILQGKLLMNVGFDCIYTTPYFADAYMPELRAFYLQNEVKTNGFPYLNVFLKLQVKRARFFIQMVNVSQGLLKNNYISVPHYPLNDRQLKFGINWYFHD